MKKIIYLCVIFLLTTTCQQNYNTKAQDGEVLPEEEFPFVLSAENKQALRAEQK